jgi:hypothetical protein
MKTKITFFLLIMVCFVSQAMAQYPIPSYNVGVIQQAYFEEQGNNMVINPIPQAKREVNIQTQCLAISTHSPCAEVWVFSLDGQDLLGPYYIDNNDILSVPIDDRLWGVYLVATYELNASVWIGGGESIPSKKVVLKHNASF